MGDYNLGGGAQVIGAQAEGILQGQDLSIDLQALLVWLGNYGYLSYEKQQELLWKLGDIEVGVGTLQATNSRIAEAVAPAVESLWDWAPSIANVHVDETPWCVMGVKEWLWTHTHSSRSRSSSIIRTLRGSERA